MYKHYMEVSYRKAWKSFSAVETGAWHTFGGLFPCYGLFAKQSLFLGERWQIAPGVSFFAKPGAEKPAKIIYYRTSAYLESAFRILKNLETFIGGTYDHYVDMDPFLSGPGVYLGIRKW